MGNRITTEKLAANDPDSDVSKAWKKSNLLSRTSYFLWHLHKKLVIGLIVFLALILLGLRGSAYYIESHPENISALIETATSLKIRFSDIEVNVNPLFPALYLKNISILDDSESEILLKFAQAKIELNVRHSLWQGRPVIEAFKLDGISTVIRRDDAGRFYIGDLLLSDRSAANNDDWNFSKGFLSFLAQPLIQITNSEFYIVDQLNKIPAMLFHDLNIKLQNQSSRHQLSAAVSLNNTDTRIDFRLDFNGDMEKINHWDGSIFAAVKSLDAVTFRHLIGEKVLQVENFSLTDFELNTQVWATVSQGLLDTIRGDISFRDASLYQLEEERTLVVDELSGNIFIERGLNREKPVLQSKDWNIDLNNIQCKVYADVLSLHRINLQYSAPHQCTECNNMSAAAHVSPQLQIYIDSLDFSKTARLVHFFSPIDFHDQLYRVLKPRGQVKDTYALVTLESLSMPIDITDYQMQASLRHFGINAMAKIPEVRNLSADVRINRLSGFVDIDSHDMKLHLSTLFRDTWPITDLSGTFEWQKDDSGWLLQGKQLTAANEHLKTKTDVNLWIPETGNKRDIFMELSSYYKDADLAYTSHYLPVAIMQDYLVQWLDKSIVSGTGTDGGAIFRGRLGGFPFKDNSGALDIVFNTRDAVLDYVNGWPKLEDLRARIQFTSHGMKAEASHGKILAAVSTNAEVDIKDFKLPVLHVTGDLTGKANDGRIFLQQSQLLSDAMLKAIDAHGDIGIKLDLSKPLKQPGADVRVSVSLKNAQYFPLGLKKKAGLMDKVNGEIFVHNKQISSDNLQARLMGQPAKLKISTSTPDDSQQPHVNIKLDSHASVQKLLEYEVLPEGLNPVWSYIDGQAAVFANIRFSYNKNEITTLISSDLKGVSSRLPFPLNKHKTERKKLSVSLLIQPLRDLTLKLDYAHQIAAALMLDSTVEPANLIKAHVEFGPGNVHLPSTEQVLITGMFEDIEAGAWLDILVNEKRKSNPQSNTRAKTISRAPLPVQLDLTKLVLPDFMNPEIPADSQTAQGGVNQLTSKDKSYLEPRGFPLINGSVEQLYVGDVLLGTAKIKSERRQDSIHFKQLAINGSLLDYKANAIWSQWKKQPRFDMQGALHIPSLESALKQFGFPDFLQTTEADLSGSIGWPGSPMDFDRENLDGLLNINLRHGRLVNTNNSNGSMNILGILNLLNMNEIFRRISLNFTDISKRGLEFNSITGDFKLSEGNAFTDNYTLLSPSLILAYNGRLGLVKQDIDATIMAIPDVSGTLPIAGAVVAGPAGAAVVWIGQKILGDKINQITALNYKVTGNWDAPKIKQQQLTKNALKNIKNISGYDKLLEVRDGFLEGEGNDPEKQKQLMQ